MCIGCNNSFPGDSDSKESACRVGDLGLIPGSGRCPGERDGSPLQYSCLENCMDRGVGWATDHGVPRLQKFFIILLMHVRFIIFVRSPFLSVFLDFFYTLKELVLVGWVFSIFNVTNSCSYL